MKTQNEILTYMKSTYCTIICLTALTLTSVLAQPAPGPAPKQPTPPAAGGSAGGMNSPSRLAKFDLDFPGGTPKQLVAAIEKAMGQHLNAIVPDEFADTSLPAVKMNSVTVPELLQALGRTSTASHGRFEASFIFTTSGTADGNSIWSFIVNKPTPPAKVCRFYSLAACLDRGLSVDDITTAIETGWKMLGETSPPTISFHKDTKLLIAVGEERKLETIDAALKALESPMGGGGGGGFQPPKDKK
jgi:hypothetical protein